MPRTTEEKVAIGLGLGFTFGLGYLAYRTLRQKPSIPPPPGMATLYGKVTDAQTGKAIEGIEVSFNGYMGITQSNGYYVIENITPGEYEITFRDPLGQYEFASVLAIHFSEGETKELNVALQPIGIEDVNLLEIYTISTQAGKIVKHDSFALGEQVRIHLRISAPSAAAIYPVVATFSVVIDGTLITAKTTYYTPPTGGRTLLLTYTPPAVGIYTITCRDKFARFTVV